MEKNFIVKGTFRLSGNIQPFEKKVKGPSKNFAEHKALSKLGSSYAIKRNCIKIESIEEA